MAIPEKILDSIRDRIDIVELISGYIPLKKAGRSYKANCPFHNEKTPSFVVSPDKQIYHCFGCGSGGNVFSFVMKYENCEFPEAVETLAKKAGVALPKFSGSDTRDSSLNNQLYKINEAACGHFQSCLANSANAMQYLASRGIGDAAIRKFRIGYAPDAWESLITLFRGKGVGIDLVEKAGLVITSDKASKYDRFRNRIIFPIIDLKEKILGFGARVLDSSLPKYVNSPETPIYSKGRNLYGLNVSREGIKKKGYALMVEGYLDFLVPFQAGVENIIATLGTALTVEQIKLIKRFAPTVVIVYDPDEAGEAASMRSLDLFLAEDMNVYIAELTAGYDPDLFIRKFGAEEFLGLIKRSKNLFDYKLEKLSKHYNAGTTHGKAAIAGGMISTIVRINNAVMRTELDRKLAERLEVDEESIRAELKKAKPGEAERKHAALPIDTKPGYRCAEVMLVAMLLEGGELADRAEKMLKPEEVKDTTVRQIVSGILSLKKENRQITPASLINSMGNTDVTASLISEAVSMSETIADRDKAMADCIARIKRDNMKERLTGLNEEIKSAHSRKDEKALRQLMAEYNSLVKEKR